MINEIKKNLCIEFLIVFILVCVIFMPFLVGHYATDTYNVINIGFHEYAIKWSLNDGRIFMALIMLIAQQLNITIEVIVFLTLFFALIVSSVSVVVINNIIKKYKNTDRLIDKILTLSMSYLIVFNFMYVEDMYFIEAFVMSVSILMLIIAANTLVENKKFSEIKTFLFVIISVLFYQGSIGLFFMMTVLFSILKNKNNYKKIIFDIIECGLIAFGAMMLDVLIVKFIGFLFNMKQTRISGIKSVLQNIKDIIKYTDAILIETCGLYPQFLYLIFGLLIVLLQVFYNSNEKKYDNVLLKIVFIFVFGIICSSLTYILSFTSFYSGRLRIAIGASIPIMFCINYFETNIFEDKRWTKYVCYGLFISYLLSNLFMYEYLILQHKKVNISERIEVAEINEYINNYENETGTSVTKVVKIRVPDRQDESYCKDTKNRSTLTYTGVRSGLVADAVIKFYTGRNLETIEVTRKKQKEIQETISNSFEDGQGYKCIDDVLYIQVYMY